MPKEVKLSRADTRKPTKKPLPKAVQQQLDGAPLSSPYTEEELAEKQARIVMQIQKMTERREAFLHKHTRIHTEQAPCPS